MNYLYYLMNKSQSCKKKVQSSQSEVFRRTAMKQKKVRKQKFENGIPKIVLIIRQITLLINVKHQKHNIYMQKEKKQSQLLSTLSEILKLYHKYLLYSLRSDIAHDRKLGMLENIRDRVRSILNKEHIQSNNFECASIGGYGNQVEISEDKGRSFIKDNGFEIKLVSRFLGRVSQKIKGYMEQFVGYEVPQFLTQNLRMIEKMNNNLVLQQLLRNLFAIGNEPSRQAKKQSRKNSSTQQLINEPQKKGKTPEISQAGPEKEVKKAGFMSGFTKKSNEIQQIMNLITIIELDEKEVRKKYFSILQYSSQFQNEQNKAVNSSNSHHLCSQNNIIIHATNINFHRQQQLSDQGSISKLNLVVQNSSYSIGNNNPSYTQMMERNKAIAQMIRKYQTNYEKHRKREHVKILRNQQRQRQKDKFKNKLASLSLEKHMNGHQSSQQFYCQQQKHDIIHKIDAIMLKQSDTEDQIKIEKLKNKQSGRERILTMDTIKEKKESEIVSFQEHGQTKKKQAGDKIQKREQAKNSNQKLLRNSSHQNNSSLPELKNIKLEEKMQSNPYNPYTNNSNIKKAQKLLRITKPKLRMGLIQQSKRNIQHKQKSLSTAAIANDNYGTHNFANFGHAHTNSLNCVIDSNTQSSCQINGNHIINLNSYTEQEFKIREGQQYSDTAINTCLYNNLNAVIKPKQLLNRFLSKVNSSASVAEHQTKILNLSKIQFISANSSLSQINPGHHSVHKKSKKTSIHRQQLEQRRAKVEALYQKQRPTQLGFLRSNLNLPRIEDVEGPSFLMACRSYQRAVQLNNQNGTSLTKNTGQEQQIVALGGK